MILIFSWDDYEPVTNAVVDWLIHTNSSFIKITPTDIYSEDNKWEIDIQRKILRFNNIDLLDKVNVVWFRKFPTPYNVIKEVYPFDKQINIELINEFRQISEYICYQLRDKTWLGSPQQDALNKLEILSHAQEVGLTIPSTIITNDLMRINSFLLEKNRMITKQINGNCKFQYRFKAGRYISLVTELYQQDLLNVPKIFPTLCQELIDAEMEIRITFCVGVIFSTAYINRFEKSSDKKNLIESKYSHIVPFNLEDNICTKIKKLMGKCDLNYACIDLLRKTNGEYVFLELNPSGQFLAESTNCLYNIEKQIANWLKDNDNA